MDIEINLNQYLSTDKTEELENILLEYGKILKYSKYIKDNRVLLCCSTYLSDGILIEENFYDKNGLEVGIWKKYNYKGVLYSESDYDTLRKDYPCGKTISYKIVEHRYACMGEDFYKHLDMKEE